MAVSISLSITQNSQSIANNTSNVTVKVTASWTYSSWNGYSRPGWVKIDGTQYNFSHSFNSGCTSSGSEVLYTKTVDVGHATDGTKTLSCSASYDSDVSSGVVTASASKTLTTIPRKSTLSVADGTLDTSQTLIVTQQSTSFKHSIKAVCGSSTMYIKSDGSTQSSESIHSGTNITFTPPLSWASQNTSSTSVSVTYTLTTYNNDGKTIVGTNTYTKTYSIPASVIPSCTVAVSDPTGNLTKYGKYVKTKSKFKVVVTATKSHGSNIASYSVSANGSTYLSGDFTTDVLKSSGTLSVVATVKDNRGRTSNSATQNLSVYDYTDAAVSSIKVDRCDSGGTPNAQGDHCKVTFNAAITSLGNINTATYKLKYKKTSASSYTTVTLSDYSGSYNVTGGYKVFAADTASSYDVIIEATDDFGTGRKSTSVSTAFSIMHFKADGTAMAIGKLSEKSNTLEVNMTAEFSSAIKAAGNIGGNYIQGTWLQSTAHTDLGGAPTSYPVFDGSGWLYHRTKNEMLSDLGYGNFAGNITFNGGEQTGERNINFKNTNGANPHNCQLYGGNPTSATGIGMWDAQNSRRILSYTDSDNKLYLGSDDGSCGTILYGSLTLGGHSTPVGSIKSGTSTTKEVAKNSTTNLTSVTLPSGVWILLGGVYTASLSTSASNGVLRVTLGDTSTSDSLNPANNNGYGTVGARAYGSSLPMYKEVVTIRDGGATVYLNVVHNIQDKLTITGQIRAIRIV